MKLLVFLLVLSTTLLGAKSSPKPQPRPQYKALLESVTSLVVAGRRFDAVAKLNQAIADPSLRSNLRDLVTRKHLVLEQFVSSESFQNYVEAKEYAELERFSDCLSQLDGIPSTDADNVLVLKLRARCHAGNQQVTEASAVYAKIEKAGGGGADLAFGKAELAIRTKQFPAALDILAKVDERKDLAVSGAREQFVLLKASALEGAGRAADAIEVLRKDAEVNLDHVVALFELGRLYFEQPESEARGKLWQARKYLSQFISRTKRISNAKTLKLVPKAQEMLDQVEKRLKRVDPV